MARFSTAQKETLRKMTEEGKLATSQLQNIMRNAEELRKLNKGGVVGFQAGGVPNPQEEQMKMPNQANQNAMQMGTGNPQSATYQASLGPAATNQQPTQFATQVTPEQMAAQQQPTQTQPQFTIPKVIDPDTGRPPETGGPVLPMPIDPIQPPLTPEPIDPIQPPLPPEPEPDLGGYDPAQGMPEKVNTDKMLEGLSWNPHSQKGIDMLLESGKLPSDEMFDKLIGLDGTEKLVPNPDKYEVSGGRENWIFTFEDGTSTVVNRYDLDKAKKTLAEEITPVISKLKERGFEEKNQQFKNQEEAYRKYISDKTAGGVTGDIKNIEEEYNKAQSAYKQEELELQRLKAQAEANPNDPYLKGLVEEKEKTVTDLSARIKQLEPTFKESQKTISDIMIEKAKDPASLVTKTKVDTIDPETAGTIIPEDTGQLKGDISYDPVKGVVTTSEGVEKADAATYDATTVSGKAKEELDKVEAATLDEFSKGVTFEGEQGELSEGAYADEALKVAADRIQKVNEKVDLEVTKQQLAEAKGKNLKAIQTKVAKSSALLDAIAAAHVVQPNELPTPQLIAEEDMAQAKAMTDTGLDKDAIPIAAKMASFSVDNGTLAKAAQGDVDSLATVEGQLGKLMKQFDDGTPAWSAGAIRAANAAMSSRGLGASSMAGAAILQAAMESALPIAQQDANTFAQMGMQNLNNRQQVAIANAAAQQGLQLQNLDNQQKANLQKSVNAFSLQTQNLSNRQAAEVANAQIRATLQGQNLSNRQQTNIAEAARYAEAANINLNNKQQAAMQDNSNALQTNLAELSSEQSAYINSANAAAALQGQVLSNDQQVSIANAARYSEAANIEFTAEQQNALHNSKLMSSIGLAELNATQAATLQNAATVANMDITNLNNRQQAAVQNAKSFLQKDMTNLSNEQQIAVFKAQATQQALFSDQAAENAAKQFNATSQNQVNQFYDNLAQQNNQFNAAQANAMEQANVNAENAALEFNANIKNNREQFNASNSLVIAQANAQWKQNVATINTAAQNEANAADAAAANAFTSTTMDEVWQRERDLMDFAFTASESEQDRINNVVLQKISADATLDAAKLKADMEADSTIGSWVRDIIFT